MSHLVNIREDIVIPQSIDYKTYMADRPTYRRLIVPPTGSSTVQITDATVDSYFEITPNVVNLHQSHLEYTATLPGVGGAYNYVYKNKPNIQSLQLYTKSGVNIVQVDYVNKLIWAIGRKSMKLSDYLCRSKNSTCHPIHGAAPQPISFAPAEVKSAAPINSQAIWVKALDPADSKAPGAITAIAAPGGAPGNNETALLTMNALNDVFVQASQVAVDAANRRPDGSYVDDRYLENQYLERGALGTAFAYNVRFPLSDIHETLFSMDKDLYFKENLIMKITWEPLKFFGFTGTSPTNPSAGATALVTAFNLTNIQLRMAVQTNRKLIESTMALTNSGLSIDIPFVTVLRNGTTPTTVGEAMNVNVKVNNGMGRSLIKIIHTLFRQDEKSNVAFDNSNRNNVDGTLTTKLGSYYTQLNSQRLQDYNLQCSTVDVPKDDYQWNAYYMKNSPIFNSNVYISNWFHEDNFSNVNNDSSVSENQLSSPGIPIDTEMTWYFFGQAGNVPVSVNHHTFIVTRKTLSISPMGVMIK